MNSAIATLPTLFAVATILAVWTGSVCFWHKGDKPHAVLMVGASVSLGLLLSATWAIAIIITGGLIYAASLVKTIGATIVTACLLFGLFTCGLWLSY